MKAFKPCNLQLLGSRHSIVVEKIIGHGDYKLASQHYLIEYLTIAWKWYNLHRISDQEHCKLVLKIHEGSSSSKLSWEINLLVPNFQYLMDHLLSSYNHNFIEIKRSQFRNQIILNQHWNVLILNIFSSTTNLMFPWILQFRVNLSLN